jgi:hypothetical protein
MMRAGWAYMPGCAVAPCAAIAQEGLMSIARPASNGPVMNRRSPSAITTASGGAAKPSGTSLKMSP